MKLMDKSNTQRLHSKKRAYERLGIHLTNADLDAIVYLIQKKKGKFVAKQSNRVTLWKVRYSDINMQVVYDKTRQTVVTVFPADMEVAPPSKPFEKEYTCSYCNTTDVYSTRKKYKICNTCGNSFI